MNKKSKKIFATKRIIALVLAVSIITSLALQSVVFGANETTEPGDYYSLSGIIKLIENLDEQESPFVVLEVTPNTASGSIGYFIKGQEPFMDTYIDELENADGEEAREAISDKFKDFLIDANLLDESDDTNFPFVENDYDELFPWESSDSEESFSININFEEYTNVSEVDFIHIDVDTDDVDYGDFDVRNIYTLTTGTDAEGNLLATHRQNVNHLRPISNSETELDALLAYYQIENTQLYYYVINPDTGFEQITDISELTTNEAFEDFDIYRKKATITVDPDTNKSILVPETGAEYEYYDNVDDNFGINYEDTNPESSGDKYIYYSLSDGGYGTPVALTDISTVPENAYLGIIESTGIEFVDVVSDPDNRYPDDAADFTVTVDGYAYVGSGRGQYYMSENDDDETEDKVYYRSLLIESSFSNQNWFEKAVFDAPEGLLYGTQVISRSPEQVTAQDVNSADLVMISSNYTLFDVDANGISVPLSDGFVQPTSTFATDISDEVYGLLKPQLLSDNDTPDDLDDDIYYEEAPIPMIFDANSKFNDDDNFNIYSLSQKYDIDANTESTYVNKNVYYYDNVTTDDGHFVSSDFFKPIPKEHYDGSNDLSPVYNEIVNENKLRIDADYETEQLLPLYGDGNQIRVPEAIRYILNYFDTRSEVLTKDSYQVLAIHPYPIYTGGTNNGTDAEKDDLTQEEVYNWLGEPDQISKFSSYVTGTNTNYNFFNNYNKTSTDKNYWISRDQPGTSGYSERLNAMLPNYYAGSYVDTLLDKSTKANLSDNGTADNYVDDFAYFDKDGIDGYNEATDVYLGPLYWALWDCYYIYYITPGGLFIRQEYHDGGKIAKTVDPIDPNNLKEKNDNNEPDGRYQAINNGTRFSDHAPLDEINNFNPHNLLTDKTLLVIDGNSNITVTVDGLVRNIYSSQEGIRFYNLGTESEPELYAYGNHSKFKGVSVQSFDDSKITVTNIGIDEFNGYTYDISEEFDMVYIGSDLSVVSSHRLKDYGSDTNPDYSMDYVDNLMDGLMYTNIGDIVYFDGFNTTTLEARPVGTLDSHYHETDTYLSAGNIFGLYSYTSGSGGYNVSGRTVLQSLNSASTPSARLSGNDLSDLKMQELIDYASFGFPIVISEALVEGEKIDTKRIDVFSKLYKALAEVDESGEYTDNAILSHRDINTSLSDNVFFETDLVNSNNKDSLFTHINISAPMIVYSEDELSRPAEYVSVEESSSMKNSTLMYEFTIENQTDPVPALTYYTVQLYYDRNSNGLFDDSDTSGNEELDELDIFDESGKRVSYKELQSGIEYTVLRELPENFVGVVPWKLVVTKNDTGIATSDTGITYNRPDSNEVIDIDVLQIVSDRGHTYSVLGDSFTHPSGATIDLGLEHQYAKFYDNSIKVFDYTGKVYTTLNNNVFSGEKDFNGSVLIQYEIDASIDSATEKFWTHTYTQGSGASEVTIDTGYVIAFEFNPETGDIGEKFYIDSNSSEIINEHSEFDESYFASRFPLYVPYSAGPDESSILAAHLDNKNEFTVKSNEDMQLFTLQRTDWVDKVPIYRLTGYSSANSTLANPVYRSTNNAYFQYLDLDVDKQLFTYGALDVYGYKDGDTWNLKNVDDHTTVIYSSDKELIPVIGDVEQVLTEKSGVSLGSNKITVNNLNSFTAADRYTNLVQSYSEMFEDLQDNGMYNINVETVNLFDINEWFSAKKDSYGYYNLGDTFDKEAAEEYLENYDIVMIGFTEFFGNLETLNKGMSYELSQSIVNHIDNGNSVLFAHDTLVTYTTPDGTNYYDENGNKYYTETSVGYAYTLMSRSYLGVDRYGLTDPEYGLSAYIPNDLRQAIVSNAGYGEENTVEIKTTTNASKVVTSRTMLGAQNYTANGYLNIASDPDALQDLVNKGYDIPIQPNASAKPGDAPVYVEQTQGYQDIYVLSMDMITQNDTRNADPYLIEDIKNQGYDQPNTTNVDQVNRGQITTFPYNINTTDFMFDEEKANENLVENASIPIATTHKQYYQLNMNDEELIVWFTLGAYKSNDMYDVMGEDAANNYYIYTKGNVTYTGAGHNPYPSPIEAQLFVNTMIASYRPKVEPPKPVSVGADGEQTSTDVVLPIASNNEQLLAALIAGDSNDNSVNKEDLAINFQIISEDITGAFSEVFEVVGFEISYNGTTISPRIFTRNANGTTNEITDSLLTSIEPGQTYTMYLDDSAFNQLLKDLLSAEGNGVAELTLTLTTQERETGETLDPQSTTLSIRTYNLLELG